MAVEKYLKGEYGNVEDLSPYFINNLYALDRAVTWHTNLKNHYEDSIILLDRYTTSSLIYQSALIENIEERKKFINYVIDFEYNKMGIKKPDLVIFLSAPYELVEKIKEMPNVVECTYSGTIGASLGINTGPGLVGFALERVE